MELAVHLLAPAAPPPGPAATSGQPHNITVEVEAVPRPTGTWRLAGTAGQLELQVEYV